MTTQVAMETRRLRDALAQFPAGVVALSARVQDERQVLVASSFSVGISEEPPLVLFSVQKSSSTWPKIKDAPLIGVSVMGEDHNPVCRQLASRNPDERFKGIETTSGERDDLYISGSPLWLTCSIYREVDAGDHILILLQIEDLQAHSSHMPLVFHRSSFSRLDPR
ncbi:flavin reductase family protein [Arthrobacter sp. I2-34]|uniref:Flavin reductase family protein n=1 Tax=Arthrobacter hankyongi TaxID=2904801 RepID=A0ABS9LB58_9MICC|nr:flavin reductase family protein [Arthrobacter hankyongi]MCG2623911.1 flavin reductase family protein [Arthrobacter hankyongi]